LPITEETINCVK